MKAFVLVLMCCTLTAEAQPFHFNTGDFFAYEFQTMSPNPLGGVPTDSFGTVILDFAGASYTHGDSIRLEFFADGLNSPVLCDLTDVSVGQISALQAPCFTDGWSDLRGAIRLTMLSGDMDLSQLRVTAFRSGDGSYVGVVPVSEPGASALLMLGAGLGFAQIRKHSNR